MTISVYVLSYYICILVVKIIVKIYKNLSERKLRFIRREKKDKESDLTIWSILKESILY